MQPALFFLLFLALPLTVAGYRLTIPHSTPSDEILNRRTPPPDFRGRSPIPVGVDNRDRTPADDIIRRTPSPLENRHSFPPADDNRGRTGEPEFNRRTPPVDGLNRGRTPVPDNLNRRTPPVEEDYRLTTPHPELDVLNRRTPPASRDRAPEFSEFIGVTVGGEQLNLLTFRSLDDKWSRTAEPDVFFHGRTPPPSDLNRRTPPPVRRFSLPGADEFFPFHGRTADPQLWNGRSSWPAPTGAADFNSVTPAAIERRSFPPRHGNRTPPPAELNRSTPPVDELGRTPVPELNRRTPPEEDILRRTHVPPFHKTPPPVAVDPVVFSTPAA